MAFSQRVEVIIDVVAEKAKAGVKSFRDSVAEAEGFTGKFKAAAGGAFDYVKDHAGQLAMAGGAAVVAYGVKAVHAFEDTAKAAINLGTATGLAVEDASRWIAIADDHQVKAESLTSSLGKISKTLDDTKWSEYGIRTRDASGAARDTNDILIDALSTLSSIKNETERARVGNELFGKGYKDLAPLVGHTADEYRKMLGAVEDGQVITDAEARKAERMRLAEDALADAVKEVQLAVGGMVAGYAPFIQRTAESIGWVVKLTEKVEGLAEALEAGFGISSGSPIAIYDAAINAATKEVDLHGLSVEQLTKMLEEAGVEGENAAAIWRAWAEANGVAIDETGGLAVEVKRAATEIQALGHDLPETAAKQVDLTEKTRDGAEAQKSVQEAIDDRLAAEQRLRDEALRQIDANYAYAQQARDTALAIAEYNDEVAAGELEGIALASATEKARLSMVATATAFANTTGAAQGTNAWISAVITSLQNQAKTIDPSSELYRAIQGYIEQLESIPTYVETSFGIKGPGVITIAPDKQRGSKGSWMGNQLGPGEGSEVAERGPETYIDAETGRAYVIGGRKGGQIVPGVPGGGGVVINMPNATFNNGTDVDGFARALGMVLAVPK